jgi:aminoacylase
MGVLLSSSWYKTIGEIGLALDEGLASELDTIPVFYGERNPWWVRVSAVGNTGHGSRFIEGTAVEMVLGIANKALAFRKEQKDLLHGTGAHAGCDHAVARTLGDVTTLNLTVLRAGIQAGGHDVLNVVPASAEAAFDIRISPHTPMEEIKTMIDSWCDEANKTHGLPDGGGVTWSFVYEPLHEHATTSLDSTNPWWELFKTTVEGTCGIGLVPSVFPAATDSRFLRAAGVKAIGFSPMRRSKVLLHEHDEYIEEKVFVEGCGVMVEVVRACAQGAF